MSDKLEKVQSKQQFKIFNSDNSDWLQTYANDWLNDNPSFVVDEFKYSDCTLVILYHFGDKTIDPRTNGIAGWLNNINSSLYDINTTISELNE